MKIEASGVMRDCKVDVRAFAAVSFEVGLETKLTKPRESVRTLTGSVVLHFCMRIFL